MTPRSITRLRPGTLGVPGRRVAARDRGQATVEFALALPIVAVVIIVVAQLGVSVRNELAVHHAARVGARAASVSADPIAASRAAHGATVLPIEVSTRVDADTVTVTVTHVDPTDAPILGVALPAVTHRASVTMALEPP